MNPQRYPIDPSREKRGNEGIDGGCAKRQCRVPSHLESLDSREQAVGIRGGMSRPRPPPLAPAPNRATQGSVPSTQSGVVGIEELLQNPLLSLSDDSDDDDGGWWHPALNQSTPNNQAQPAQNQDTGRPGTTVVNTPTGLTTPSGGQNQPGNQGMPTTPNQPAQNYNVQTPQSLLPGNQQLPTPQTGPSIQGPRAATGARPSGGPPTATVTNAGQPVQPPVQDGQAEILQLFDRLQEMIVAWVDECLPDTFPPDFPTQKPESYWELCGWCKPLTLGNRMLANGTYAKYVYESWVWRFLHQEILRFGSITWAGNDVEERRGGPGGRGQRLNDSIAAVYNGGSQCTMMEYIRRVNVRRTATNIISSYVTQDRHDKITARLVTEMLVAFHPYFSDAYMPVDQPQNIEVLMRDTNSIILKARELDWNLRRADHFYEFILGREGEVCQIPGVPSPAIQRYEGAGNVSTDFDDQSRIGLIVVPGLIKFVGRLAIDTYPWKLMVRQARAFDQSDLATA